MLEPVLQKNDKKAKRIIGAVSIFVFLAIVALSRVQIHVNPGFDVHLFARINVVLNCIVAVLLIFALLAVKVKQYTLHKNIMMSAIVLSVFFLLSYICHHLLAGETRFGDANFDGIVSATEKAAVGNARIFYYIILGTHIPLAAIILPFILFSAYRALSGDYEKHKKLVRITWPVWLYVAVSGVIVYVMISPYYH
ncbi:MAG TPA: DUF420 domain-containing protein [Chitinophagaceae bacterium]|nr:DUF420 domain-containing protein [Chitinophagaceae bacterium]